MPVVLGGTTVYMQHNLIVPFWSLSTAQASVKGGGCFLEGNVSTAKGIHFCFGFSGLVLPGAGNVGELPRAIKTGGRCHPEKPQNISLT